MRASGASALAGLAALALAPAAHAATVSVPGSCYAEGDRIPIEGGGFTPHGGVTLTFERNDTALVRSEEPRADAEGAVRGTYTMPLDTGFFGRRERRFAMTLRLADRTSPDAVATTAFTFSRRNVAVTARGGTLHPRRRARVAAVGFTHAIGRPLYAHYVLRGRRVKTRRLGRLRGPCGDRTATLRRGFPFRPVAKGAWRVVFNASARKVRARGSVTHRVRVPRRVGR